MTTLRQRRNALLLMRLVEHSAHGSLQFALLMQFSLVTNLSLQERGIAYGAIGVGEIIAHILGGIVADRWLGYRRAVLGGAALVALGYVVLSLDQWLTIGAGLAVLTLGRGLHGHAVPALLGDLREPRDARRDMDFLLLRAVRTWIQYAA
jgi:POT family proton-dependent oligopeptide transporter